MLKQNCLFILWSEEFSRHGVLESSSLINCCAYRPVLSIQAKDLARNANIRNCRPVSHIKKRWTQFFIGTLNDQFQIKLLHLYGRVIKESIPLVVQPVFFCIAKRFNNHARLSTVQGQSKSGDAALQPTYALYYAFQSILPQDLFLAYTCPLKSQFSVHWSARSGERYLINHIKTKLKTRKNSYYGCLQKKCKLKNSNNFQLSKQIITFFDLEFQKNVKLNRDAVVCQALFYLIKRSIFQCILYFTNVVICKSSFAKMVYS